MTQINRYLDEPITLFSLEMDEIVVVSSCIFIGIMVDMLITLGFVGVICMSILRRIKKTSSEGVMLHFLHWHGFFTLRRCMKSYMREFVE
jgi:type IV conjugative transfer system protein TraL